MLAGCGSAKQVEEVGPVVKGVPKLLHDAPRRLPTSEDGTAGRFPGGPVHVESESEPESAWKAQLEALLEHGPDSVCDAADVLSAAARAAPPDMPVLLGDSQRQEVVRIADGSDDGDRMLQIAQQLSSSELLATIERVCP